MKPLLSFALLLAVSVASFAQKATIALNLKKGNTYYIVSTINLNVTQMLNGQEQKILSAITCKAAHKVIDVRDSTYIIEVSYERIGMQLNAAGQDIAFNS